MITKFKNYILVATALTVLSSCNDYLDLKPISDATAENAYVTANDAEAALVGVYDSFSQEYYIWDNIIFNDVMSDNYYAGGDNAEIFAVENLEVVPTNGRLFNNWSQIYNAIAKANTVLAKVPGIVDAKLENGNRRNQILGEASFLRAFHYYQLVKMWGGVPLITKPVASTAPSETQIERSTEAEVYAQIIADLEFAVQNLPDTYGDVASVNKARATKGAANAMLAKVYAQKADRDYDKVIQYADAVINSPAGYTLLDNFADLWDGAHYNNAESIMEVQFVGAPEGNWGPGLLLPPSITGDTWRKFVTPSHDLINAFDAEGDVERKTASILFEKAPWADEFWSKVVNGDVPFAFKWKSASSGASTNRQYIVRLADILLLKAEALNVKGQTDAAKTLLNQVRHRAGLGDTPATNAELKTAILNERRLELAQEAQRWDDLRRNNVAVDVMNALQEMNIITEQMKVYKMTTEKQLLPIPQSERNRNQVLGQNPGYN
ncbi:RagB/SusD family nutrient uptake outer membrane protein [Chryseolinea lacunae]|uniref:RagB/SusD family nutrient uptake outer membrane protein n=1 Tax=Chryseolinea lacunae TaxID=2801331 RepID=A0ABS1KMX4_9BACT|nr:RagB/SusD family nutrient uptake outer membrane protein [Chryseolinea lacunae]MBL0740791.1 RagB/SusD family nutrient uptake outer membrane protein [Chryseolinea lacunae]